MSAPRTVEDVVDIVRDLITQRESACVEFKENNADPHEIGEYISALANSAALEGSDQAWLIWGVSDQGALVGTTFRPLDAKKSNESLVNWLTRLLNPQVFFRFYELSLDGIHIIALEIARASHQPVSFSGTEYIRVGSHKKSLREHVDYERRLWRHFDESPFESGSAANRVTGDDVLRLIDYPAYFELIGTPLPDHRSGILQALAEEGLISASPGSTWSVTNLGGLLFAKRLDAFPTLGRKAMRIVQYRGNSRRETLREQLWPMGYAAGFRTMVDYAVGLIPTNEVIQNALRRTVSMFPSPALRELMANALIHQDFALKGTGPWLNYLTTVSRLLTPGLHSSSPLDSWTTRHDRATKS